MKAKQKKKSFQRNEPVIFKFIFSWRIIVLPYFGFEPNVCISHKLVERLENKLIEMHTFKFIITQAYHLLYQNK